MSKTKVRHILQEVQVWVFWAILASIFFVIVGDGVPKIYWSTVDISHFYSIESPVKTDKEIYKKGATMILSAEKKSKIDVKASSIQELVLLKQDGQKVEVSHTYSPAFLSKGNETISVQVLLPKDISAGDYRWQGIISYDIYGISKSTTWYSDIFRVR